MSGLFSAGMLSVVAIKIIATILLPASFSPLLKAILDRYRIKHVVLAMRIRHGISSVPSTSVLCEIVHCPWVKGPLGFLLYEIHFSWVFPTSLRNRLS